MHQRVKKHCFLVEWKIWFWIRIVNKVYLKTTLLFTAVFFFYASKANLFRAQCVLTVVYTSRHVQHNPTWKSRQWAGFTFTRAAVCGGLDMKLAGQRNATFINIGAFRTFTAFHSSFIFTKRFILVKVTVVEITNFVYILGNIRMGRYKQ